MKIVAIIVAVVLIAAIGFMVYKTVSYMWSDGYDLGSSIEFAWDDMLHLRVTRETKKNLEGLASRDAEFGISYIGLRTID